MGIIQVKKLAVARRERRWEKEQAARLEGDAHALLLLAIADWQGVPHDQIKFSNNACNKAPADLHCVYVRSSNPMRNPCLFCQFPEESVY